MSVEVASRGILALGVEAEDAVGTSIHRLEVRWSQDRDLRHRHPLQHRPGHFHRSQLPVQKKA